MPWVPENMCMEIHRNTIIDSEGLWEALGSDVVEMKKNLIWGDSTLKIHVPITDFLSDSKHLCAKQNVCSSTWLCLTWHSEFFNRRRYWSMSGKRLLFFALSKGVLMLWTKCCLSFLSFFLFSFFTFHLRKILLFSDSWLKDADPASTTGNGAGWNYSKQVPYLGLRVLSQKKRT